jgi:hypothetical protein
MPEYSSSAREVLSTLRSVQEPDETVWWDRALLVLSDLSPQSAIGYALHRPNVWSREYRVQLRQEGAPDARIGLLVDDLIEAAEAAAAADNSRMVTELHLARALAPQAQALLQLKVLIDPLIETVEQRVAPAPGASVSKRPRISGVARVPILDELLSGIDLSALLDEEERSGRVERKRSILNLDEGRLVSQVDTAVALVNGNRESPCFLLFGQDDDHTVCGEVDHRGSAIPAELVTRCQGRLVSRLQQCRPAVIVKWELVEPNGKRVWAACLLGRERGALVQTPHGSYPIRSGETTHLAGSDEIIASAREAFVADADASADPRFGPSLSTELRAADAAPSRGGLSELRRSVAALLSAPPDIPNQIRGGRQPEDWQAVHQPILSHFEQSIAKLVDLGVAGDDEQTRRLGRGMRDAFSLQHQPRGGNSWIVEAPRFVCRITADQILAHSYIAERWKRITELGLPAFDSYIGRVPWITSPEYAFPETAGHNAYVAHAASLQYAAAHADRFRALGADDSDVRRALSAVSLGVGLAMMAREALGGVAVNPAWIAITLELWPELETWEEEPGIVEAFAILAGEHPNLFAARMPERLVSIVNGMQSAGLYLGSPDLGIAAARRIGQAGQRAFDQSSVP